MKDHISKNIDIYSSDKFQSFLDDISNEVKKESSSIILTKDHK
ncbi:MAG: hypothetical protein U9Q66_01790 [Patescibacteria group bacterium]|nr:hypothetical protein [Patescibacteria group bacterium]